ncbi:sigma 54-interacting transcriptional regulator [Paraphotobacterium marinum]|nr:sigma 54-interacting transcriptional regulator [Paraphotobacterium marinum]
MYIQIVIKNDVGVCFYQILDVFNKLNMRIVKTISKENTLQIEFENVHFKVFSELMKALREIELISDVKTVSFLYDSLHEDSNNLLYKIINENIISLNHKYQIINLSNLAIKTLKLNAKNQKTNFIGESILDFIPGYSDSLKKTNKTLLELNNHKYIAKTYPLKEKDMVNNHKGYILKLEAYDKKILKRKFEAIFFEDLIGESKLFLNTIEVLKNYANVNEPLFLYGETGTGKEILARCSHNYSERKNFPFIVISCASIPDYCLETELFGIKVLSSGRVSRGIFELANGGTVFFDNASEMSSTFQTKLLRLLETKTFRRVGSEEEIKVDVKIICSAQMKLKTLMNQGLFRKDLYYRLNALSIDIPPLRYRKNDITLFCKYFFKEYSHKQTYEAFINKYPQFEKEVLQNFWYGNIRELKNYLLNKIFDVNTSNTFYVDEIDSQQSLLNQLEYEKRSLDVIMKNYEAKIFESLYKNYPSTRKLAKRLGISHTAVANKLKEYVIKLN